MITGLRISVNDLGQYPAARSASVSARRQPRPPALGEHPDRGGSQGVADALQPGRVVGGGEPVVQLGEPDPRGGGGAFGVLVSVEPFLIGYGK